VTDIITSQNNDLNHNV